MAWVETDDPLIVKVWPDAPTDDNERELYLLSAFRQCSEFAPALAESEAVPENYRLASIVQARNLHRATIASLDGTIGLGGPLTTFPMDWQVKNLLRPAPGPFGGLF
jgi:hypothetical protein